MTSLTSSVRHSVGLLLALSLTHIALQAAPAVTPQNGLLFYLSGEEGTTPDFSAAGTKEPNFSKEITLIKDGAKGSALSCSNTQLLAYRAPGNIFAQRGTLSLFWRSRYPVGPTEFPIFRVGYADHSSWDMVWLRVDYNGHGFDAFVTDINLVRTRVSVTLNSFPKPDEWVHLTLAWDETRGIRFYVNGKLAAEQKTAARYDAALDQFGPHSRVISPYQVQSDYNFVRGGDIDELRIYDRMLSDENIATLAKGDAPTNLPSLPARNLADAATRDEWNFRYGWNRPDDQPPYLADSHVSIRKVEITDAFDLKRWWWKANDGIRETTWPGVYNRSRLAGRNDYFQLPDWDCYVESGKVITFTLPNEAWNHVEIAGAPAGTADLLGAEGKTSEAVKLFQRPDGQEKTVNTLTKPVTGGRLRFTNENQEDAIGELGVYNVTAGNEPAGTAKLAYRLSSTASSEKSLAPLTTWIAGRFASDERATLIAQPAGAISPTATTAAAPSLPLVHILIPNKTADKAHDLDAVNGGLDGIAIDLPALKCTPNSKGLIALNIQVKDPIWPLRDMADFTFSVKPGEAKTLWLDLRDRILAPGRALYLTIASSSADFGPASLRDTELRLIFKSKEAALAEHSLDRFTQVRDAYAMFVEERPGIKKYDMFNRIDGDVRDLMRVNPTHVPGLNYAAAWSDEFPQPAFTMPKPPAGVPAWAFYQVQLLDRVDRFVNWYIDNRQVPYGDFGGGISDDVDLLNLWPSVALMGNEPDKIRHSLNALLDASFKNGMWTNGLPAIQADELHSYEEGINCLGQNLILDYGSPKQIERALETSRNLERLTAVNAAGHRHIRSSYYNGTTFATDEPWGWAKAYSHLVLQTPELLVDFNGSPRSKQFVLEVTDGLLAHRHKNAEGVYRIPTAIRFATDEDVIATRGWFPWPLFWNAWQWTGDRKYLDPIFDLGLSGLASLNPNALDLLDLRKEWGPRILDNEVIKSNESRSDVGRKQSREALYRGAAGSNHFAWQLTGDKSRLTSLYENQCRDAAALEYINTEGSLWIDRVGVPSVELQRARLGGVALVRNSTFPGHVISWRFTAPATDKSVAILVPFSNRKHLTVIAYNLEEKPVKATMTGWDIDPGVWEISQGLDTNDDDKADRDVASSTQLFERSRSIELTLAPRATTVLTLNLKQPGTPYWQRPDLGLTSEDIQINGREVRVRIHSLGAITSPATTVALRDATGQIVAKAQLAPIAAPVDLFPKIAEVTLPLPEGFSPTGSSIEIDPEHALEEITLLNNTAKL
jgi:hypothetical protein